MGVMPPKPVAADFNQTLAAEQTRRRLVQEGRARADARLADAAGSSRQAQRFFEIITELEDMERAVLRGEVDAAELARRETLLEQELQRAGGGSAAERLLVARSERWTRENTAFANVGRVPSVLVAFEAVPEVFMRREILRALTEAMSGRPKTVILTDSDAVRLNLENENAGGTFLDSLELPNAE
jgi:hypothetical protein